jgi:hypothetical protein
MITVWATVLVASLGCYGLKLAGVSLPESVLNHPESSGPQACCPS